ncbi:MULTISPECIES: type I-E CRISPR-associated protein Cse1/CasA [Parafrankia]|nr:MULTISPECIES: type I-E CRISPR-associated protein Cse1/CasA [Parafrankia]MBE3200228.1 type I-E CRISPR-associated protein Cse1/CasA [Parafrankia sp. CH37]
MVSGPAFDLRRQPWVPVREETAHDKVGLQDVLERAHELTDIDVPMPPAAVGLWRVLTLLAARVTELDKDDLSAGEFLERRSKVLERRQFAPDDIEKYFGRYPGRFDLFDRERPWLQDPRLATECSATSGLNRIVFGRSSGNNQVWLGHHTDLAPRPVPAAEGAWHLLATLYYGPSGRCTTRTVKGRSEGNTAAGPLRSGLSCHPVGKNLFESLIAGIPVPDDGDEYRDNAEDEAPWEADGLGDPLRGPAPLRGMARVLAGRFQHAVLLTPDPSGKQVVDATMTWAWRTKGNEGLDPYLIYQTNKKGEPYPRQASATRATWRDLDALLLDSDEQHHRPAVLSAVQYLPPETVQHMRVRVFGFDQDGQTRDRQFFTQTTPPVLRWLQERDPAFAYGVGRVRDAAERVGRNLTQALKAAWALQADPADDGMHAPSRLDGGPGPWVAAADGRYWPAAERVFWDVLRRAEQATEADGDPLAVFQEAPARFVQEAERAYDDIADQVDARTHGRMTRALARYRGRLRSGI